MFIKKISQKNIFISIVLISILLLSLDAVARAGGGGGSGGGGGFGGRHGYGIGIFKLILFILWGIYTAIISFLVFIKSGWSKRIISRASQTDKVWNLDEMKNHSERVFRQMQDAWSSRELSQVRDIITQSLFDDYAEKLDAMRMNNERNILRDIDIDEIKIIGCRDYKDNSKDSFIAYIKGTILDYTVDDRTGNTIKNENQNNEKFTDTYYFHRSENKWLLNFIDNDVNLLDVVIATSYKE